MKIKLNDSQINCLPQDIGDKEKVDELILFKVRDNEFILDKATFVNRYVSFSSVSSGYKMIRENDSAGVFFLEKTVSKRNYIVLLIFFIFISLVFVFLSYNSENFLIDIAKSYLGFAPFFILTLLYVYLVGLFNRRQILRGVKNTFTIL
jgi:hypothetical protein